MIPSWVVVECAHTLPALLALLRRTDMPTVDVDAALQQIVEAATDKPETSEDSLSAVARYMCDGEGLSENWIFEDESSRSKLQELLMPAIVQFGQEVKRNLLAANASMDGSCPLSYRSLINDTTILLSVIGKTAA